MPGRTAVQGHGQTSLDSQGRLFNDILRCPGNGQGDVKGGAVAAKVGGQHPAAAVRQTGDGGQSPGRAADHAQKPAPGHTGDGAGVQQPRHDACRAPGQAQLFRKRAKGQGRGLHFSGGGLRLQKGDETGAGSRARRGLGQGQGALQFLRAHEGQTGQAHTPGKQQQAGFFQFRVAPVAGGNGIGLAPKGFPGQSGGRGGPEILVVRQAGKKAGTLEQGLATGQVAQGTPVHAPPLVQTAGQTFLPDTAVHGLVQQ